MEVKKKRDGTVKVLLKDEDIRPILFEYMEERKSPIRFFEELVLGKSRADAVMIAPDEEDPERLCMTGFEIKSDKDQLNRLQKQSRSYSHFCDYNYLVTGEKYLETASEEIPEHWGIYLVRAEAKDIDGAVPDFFVEQIRPAKPTPRLRLTTQMSLLWRTELVSVIRAGKLGGVSGKSKRKLVDLIIEKLGREEAHRQLCLLLLDRDYTIWEVPKKPEEGKTEKKKKGGEDLGTAKRTEKPGKGPRRRPKRRSRQ